MVEMKTVKSTHDTAFAHVERAEPAELQRKIHLFVKNDQKL